MTRCILFCYFVSVDTYEENEDETSMCVKSKLVVLTIEALFSNGYFKTGAEKNFKQIETTQL